MKKFARGLALTVVALIGLVPIQATSASAFAGTLDVEGSIAGTAVGEAPVAVANSVIRWTATITPPAANTQIAEDSDGLPAPPDPVVCTTTVAVPGSCTWTDKEAAGDKKTLRLYVKDPEPPATPCGFGLPDENCDPDETLSQVDADDTDVVEYEFENGTLDLSPEDVPAAPATSVSITANIMSTEATPRGLIGNVDAEIISGPETDVAGKADMECTTAQAGSCMLTYTTANPPATAINEVQGWIDLNDDPGASPATGDETGAAPAFEGDATERQNEGLAAEKGATNEPDNTDVVKVNITVGTPGLTLSPKTQTKTTNTAASFTASVNLGNTPQQNVKIAGATITGSGNLNKTATCTTGANGTCVLTYTGTAAGTDKFRAAIDSDGNGQPNEADATEDIGTAGGNTMEPDNTDVAQVTYQNPTPPPDGGGGGGDDDGKCNAAKQKLKKAKKALKKAKQGGDEDKITKTKKKVKKAKNRKVAACAG